MYEKKTSPSLFGRYYGSTGLQGKIVVQKVADYVKSLGGEIKYVYEPFVGSGSTVIHWKDIFRSCQLLVVICLGLL